MSTKKIAQYGMLTSVMLVLGFIERQFMLVPGIPGIRLGLSNAVLLYALCLISARGGWLLMGLKVVLGGFLYAGVTGMIYSFAGGLLSMAAMLIALRIRGIGIIGISVSGAVLHMAGQILVSRLMLSSWVVAVQAPLLMVAAVITGVLTGIIAHSVCQAVARETPDSKNRLVALGLVGGKSRDDGLH